MKKPTNIHITMVDKNINHMRYKDIGDWIVDETFHPYLLNLDIFAGDMKNLDYNFLVLLHELIESYLCYMRGITDEEVTKWDLEHPDSKEPGNLRDAPYFLEHEFATTIEAMMSVELGVNWTKYEKAIEKTLRKYKKK